MAKNNKQIQFLFLPPHSEITKSWQLKLQDTFDIGILKYLIQEKKL